MPHNFSLLHTMSLLSALSAAVEIASGMHERRAGVDPTEQEREDVARSSLLEERDVAQQALLQLRASLVIGQDEDNDPLAYSVRRFNQLQQFNRLIPLFQRIHQRLLSLYPLVSEELVEEAREMVQKTATIIDAAGGNRYHEEAGAFVERSSAFCARLLREIDTIPPPRPSR